MKKCIVFYLLVVHISAFAQNGEGPLNLTKGGYRDPSTGEFSDPHVGRSLLEAGAYGLSGFANLGQGDTYHVLIDHHLANINVEAKTVISSRPLTRWPHEYLEPEYRERLKAQHDDPQDRRLMVNPKALGCFSASPLWYGSIDSTGTDYLVLFMANDFLMFSPEKGKVIFAATLSLSDWMTRSETRTFYEDEQGVLRESEKDPQYVSSIESVSARGGALPPREPGYRGYGKLYFGDFNEDESPDILLWRKLYVSRLVGDETEGFEHLDDTLIHYELVDGEYQPRDTEEDVIRNWLDENELSWQKGYPSESECEGEEGELIPEMHDPLLNDPDVLQ